MRKPEEPALQDEKSEEAESPVPEDPIMKFLYLHMDEELMAQMHGVPLPKKNAWDTPGQIVSLIKEQPKASVMKQSAEVTKSPERKTKMKQINQSRAKKNSLKNNNARDAMKSEDINCPSSDREKRNDEWSEVPSSHQNKNDSGMTSLPPCILPMPEASPSDGELTIIVAGTNVVTSPFSKASKLAPAELVSNLSDPKASNHNGFMSSIH